MAAVIVANLLTYLGQFTLYTYLTVVLLRSGASTTAMAPLLFLFGLFGLVGLWRVAPLLDSSPRRTSLAVLAVVIVGVLAVGISVPHLVLVVVAAVIWNTAFGPVASMFQSAAVRTHAMSPEMSGAWINAGANAGIGAGALVGSVVLAAIDVQAIAWAAAISLLLALLMMALSRDAFGTSTPTSTEVSACRIST